MPGLSLPFICIHLASLQEYLTCFGESRETCKAQTWEVFLGQRLKAGQAPWGMFWILTKWTWVFEHLPECDSRACCLARHCHLVVPVFSRSVFGVFGLLMISTSWCSTMETYGCISGPEGDQTERNYACGLSSVCTYMGKKTSHVPKSTYSNTNTVSLSNSTSLPLLKVELEEQNVNSQDWTLGEKSSGSFHWMIVNRINQSQIRRLWRRQEEQPTVWKAKTGVSSLCSLWWWFDNDLQFLTISLKVQLRIRSR